MWSSLCWTIAVGVGAATFGTSPAGAEIIDISCIIHGSNNNPWVFSFDTQGNTVRGDGGIVYSDLKVTDLTISFKETSDSGSEEYLRISRVDGSGQKTHVEKNPRTVTNWTMSCERLASKRAF